MVKKERVLYISKDWEKVVKDILGLNLIIKRNTGSDSYTVLMPNKENMFMMYIGDLGFNGHSEQTTLFFHEFGHLILRSAKMTLTLTKNKPKSDFPFYSLATNILDDAIINFHLTDYFSGAREVFHRVWEQEFNELGVEQVVTKVENGIGGMHMMAVVILYGAYALKRGKHFSTTLFGDILKCSTDIFDFASQYSKLVSRMLSHKFNNIAYMENYESIIEEIVILLKKNTTQKDANPEVTTTIENQKGSGGSGGKLEGEKDIFCSQGRKTTAEEMQKFDEAIERGLSNGGGWLAGENVSYERLTNDIRYYSFPVLVKNLERILEKLIKGTDIPRRPSSVGLLNIPRYVEQKVSKSNFENLFYTKPRVGLHNSKWFFLVDLSGSTSSEAIENYTIENIEMDVMFSFLNVLPEDSIVGGAFFADRIKILSEGVSPRRFRGMTISGLNAISKFVGGGTIWDAEVYNSIFRKAKEGFQVVILTDGAIGINQEVENRFADFIIRSQRKPIVLFFGTERNRSVVTNLGLKKEFDYNEILNLTGYTPSLETYLRWVLGRK
ncbi:MAG: VWA domain-containing protein [Candidatus Parvarchaeum sp.]